jgi:hypothetical protein
VPSSVPDLLAMSGRGVKRAATTAMVNECKKLRKTPSEELTSKKCKDNLKDYTDEEIWLKKNDAGDTPADEVLDAVRRKMSEPEYACGVFYTHLRFH